MAIIAEIKLVELKNGRKPSGSYSVNAAITDDSKPVDQQKMEVNDILSARIETPEQKKALWDEIIKLYHAKCTAVSPTANVEDEAKVYIEGKMNG